MRRPQVVIIGGGLAGMTIAKELRKQDVPVTILESTDRLGGKASADFHNGRYIEHGYHVFPGWYRNVRALLREIGAYDNLIDLDRFNVLFEGQFPKYFTFYQFSPFSNALRNVFSGIMPWHQLLLTFYFVLDLQSQAWRHRGFLDRVSVNGFLNSRFYTSSEMAEFQQFTALQASSIANYELSAMSSQTVARAWMRTPAPLFSILNGNLQEKFIDPFADELRRLGAAVRLKQSVTRIHTRNGRVSNLELKDGASALELGFADICVLTTPLEVTLQLVDAELYATEDDSSRHRAAPRLSDLVQLESAPMAALHLYLKRTLDHIPPAHVNLQRSRFGMSFIDVSQHWAGLAHTTLSVIASDFAPLRELPEDQQQRYLIEELQRFLPLDESDIAQSFLRSNVSIPLFLNTVGSWRFRPGTRTRIPNLYTAGDYCKSEADLTTMESAVISALNTTRDLIADLGGTHPGPLSLNLAPRWLASILKWAGLPFIAPLGLPNWIFQRMK